MASFASYRRSGWVRVLVVILCALFILATIGAPPAHALAVESVAVFGLASVLSAATAALGFKLASNEQGQATLQKMVQDFKTVSWATGFVLVGSKLNGLQHGMDYIKMQVQNGKTYLDSRVFAWVQQSLAKNGVYSDSSFSFPSVSVGEHIKFTGSSLSTVVSVMNTVSPGIKESGFQSLLDYYHFDFNDGHIYNLFYQSGNGESFTIERSVKPASDYEYFYLNDFGNISSYNPSSMGFHWYNLWIWNNSNHFVEKNISGSLMKPKPYIDNGSICFNNLVGVTESSNNTGLSGTDTLGKDVVDLTLDQVLQKLKDWAQDWFDAGADSATNAATGAQDLPLTVSTGAATANPSIAEDGPLVWFPPFSVPIPNLRTGETDTKTVDQGKENASAAETSTVDVAENQTVIDSLVNWALSYISPDTGLFSKFPLCVPYDAYLLVTSSLGVDAVGSDSIFGASPGDLEGVVSQDIETYSDFQPIINIKHDFELDGKTYPVELTIDLTPWQPLVTFFREGMALLLVAELIGSEFKRIRGH